MNQKFTYKLDFEKLRAWRNSDEKQFPILGFIDFYRACGALDEIAPIMKEKGRQICPVEIFFCTPETLMKIRNLIYETWEKFNIEYKDGQIQWIPGQPHTQRKHGKKLKAIIRDTLHWEQGELCPNIDGNIEQDVLICQIVDPEDEIKEEDPDSVKTTTVVK